MNNFNFDCQFFSLLLHKNSKIEAWLVIFFLKFELSTTCYRKLITTKFFLTSIGKTVHHTVKKKLVKILYHLSEKPHVVLTVLWGICAFKRKKISCVPAMIQSGSNPSAQIQLLSTKISNEPIKMFTRLYILSLNIIFYFRVLSSARFRAINGIIYIQIQQAALTKNNFIDNSTIEWRPVKTCQETSRTWLRPKDFIQLDDIKVVGNLPTGLKLTKVKNENDEWESLKLSVIMRSISDENQQNSHLSKTVLRDGTILYESSSSDENR